MAALRAVLFDLDGTLYDRDAALRRFAAEQHQMHRDILGSIAAERYVEQFVALDANGMVGKDIVYSRILEGIGAEMALAATLHAEYRERFALHCRASDGVPATLVALRDRGLKLGVVTNGPTAVQQRTLAALALGDVFDAVLVSEAEGVRKPDPAIFHRATSRRGVEATASVFVGDNPVADVGGARAAGLRGIWLETALFAPPAAADATIRSLAELPALLAAW